jgi:hypothetical protein
MLAPEGGAGADGGAGSATGGDAGAAAGDEGSGDAAAAAAAAKEGGDQKAEPPVRPDYIPENFWDPEKGFKADDFNALVSFKAEQDANRAQVPEKPDGYEVKLPKSFKLPEGFELPEGQEIINADDPRIATAREFAHAKQMSQSDFEDLVAFGAQVDIAERGRLNEALGQQVEALGGKAKERISAVTTWLGAKLGGDMADALAPMMFTAKSIQAFEAIMRLNRGAVPGNPGAGRDSGKAEMSDEEYSKMSASERINYARQASKK